MPLAAEAAPGLAPLSHSLRRQRSDVGAFRRLLAAASPPWLTDPAANLTLLVPTDMAMQHSALLVAAFAGPPSDQDGAAAPSAAAAGAAAAPGNGSPGGASNSSSEGGPKASAEQLLGVYQLERSLPLSGLAALDGSLLQTGAGGWALRVHAGPPPEGGVSACQRGGICIGL